MNFKKIVESNEKRDIIILLVFLIRVWKMRDIKNIEEFQSKIKRIIITEEQIKKKIEKVGKQISDSYDGRPFLLVSILKGSFVFLADLCRAITVPCEIGFMCAKSYYSGTVSTGKVEITMDLDRDISDYHVIIVEDIIDSGNTLSFISKYLAAKHAGSVKICTLLNKPSRRQTDIPVDYIGVDIPDEFVVGYGLDFAEYYRNLPYIGILKPSVYS